jgi:hypothetical protein
MTKIQKTLDEVTREVLRNGPMRATFPNGKRSPSIEEVATSPAGWRSPDPSTACLEAEQRRLLTTWEKPEPRCSCGRNEWKLEPENGDFYCNSCGEYLS